MLFGYLRNCFGVSTKGYVPVLRRYRRHIRRLLFPGVSPLVCVRRHEGVSAEHRGCPTWKLDVRWAVEQPRPAVGRFIDLVD